MSRPTMETRRVSIATIVPTKNKDEGNWLQGRKLTPYVRLPNSYVQIGQTPQNSYAPGFEREPAASPRKIGQQQSPRPVAGQNLICSSYVAQRLMSFRRREDQENEGSGLTDAQLSYRNKNVPSSSVRDITKRLADGKLDQDMALKQSLSFAKVFKDEGQWHMPPLRMSCINKLDGKKGDAHHEGPSESSTSNGVQPINQKAKCVSVKPAEAGRDLQ